MPEDEKLNLEVGSEINDPLDKLDGIEDVIPNLYRYENGDETYEGPILVSTSLGSQTSGKVTHEHPGTEKNGQIVY